MNLMADPMTEGLLDNIIPVCGEVRVYGISNGNGPAHLLSADRAATLCGVGRFGIHRDIYGDIGTQRRICTRCLAIQRAQLRAVGMDRYCVAMEQHSAAALSEIERAKTVTVDALAQIRAGRIAFHEALRILVHYNADTLDEVLLEANKLGYSLADLGKLADRSRERIRQRISRVAMDHNMER
jgi:hypothetical protein